MLSLRRLCWEKTIVFAHNKPAHENSCNMIVQKINTLKNILSTSHGGLRMTASDGDTLHNLILKLNVTLYMTNNENKITSHHTQTKLSCQHLIYCATYPSRLRWSMTLKMLCKWFSQYEILPVDKICKNLLMPCLTLLVPLKIVINISRLFYFFDLCFQKFVTPKKWLHKIWVNANSRRKVFEKGLFVDQIFFISKNGFALQERRYQISDNLNFKNRIGNLLVVWEPDSTLWIT